MPPAAWCPCWYLVLTRMPTTAGLISRRISCRSGFSGEAATRFTTAVLDENSQRTGASTRGEQQSRGFLRLLHRKSCPVLTMWVGPRTPRWPGWWGSPSPVTSQQRPFYSRRRADLKSLLASWARLATTRGASDVRCRWPRRYGEICAQRELTCAVAGQIKNHASTGLEEPYAASTLICGCADAGSVKNS